MKLQNILLLILLLFGCNNSSPEANDKTITEVSPPDQVPEVQKEKSPENDSAIQNQQVFKKELKNGKVEFQVFCKNEEETNLLIIKTKGFEVINDSFTHKINGKVTNAEIADLNNDGYPELYVFTISDNPKELSEIIAYGSNRNKSATPIYVKPIAKNIPSSNSINGTDTVYIKDNKLVREFPKKYLSGKKTKIIYSLKRGETSLILEAEKAESGQ